jgi:hypothetical protein
MLATVIALHLALAQYAEAPAAEAAAPPREDAVQADRASTEPAAIPAAPEAEVRPQAEAGMEEEAELKPARELPPPVRMRTRSTPKSALKPIPSLLSAEPLGPHAAILGWAGWSAIGVGWAQGVTSEDDIGLIGDLDWSTGELRASAFYRRPLGRTGRVEIGSRLRIGWYADFGAQWIQDDNLKDRGVEFVPGIVLSTRGAGGIFSLGGDLPITVTMWRDGGIFAAPKLSLSFETLLYGELTVGVRVAASYRAGAGDAPMMEPRGLVDIQALAGWKL